MDILFCKRCEKDLHVSEFNKQSSNSTGFRQPCKSCRKKESRKYYQSNRSALKEKARKYREENPNVNQKYYRDNKKYFEDYREKNKKKYEEWRRENRKKLNEYRRNKIENDPSFKVACNLRSRLSTLVKRRKENKGSKTLELLGCSFQEFKEKLEANFKEGMTWENYGEWHIDHITPCSSFDLSKEEGQAKCFHFSNLQPLWAEENLQKGSSRRDYSTKSKLVK